MKKLFWGLIPFALALLVGCPSFVEGDVKDNIGSEGKYHIFTIAQRGDKELGTTRNDTETQYVRVFKQFGNQERVTDATCTIKATKLDAWGDSVTAFMFGLEKSSTKGYSYYILGIMPNGAQKNKYYLEHYANVPSGALKESAAESTVVPEKTDNGDGTFTQNIYKYNGSGDFVTGEMDWTTLPSGSYTTDTTGTTYEISIKQELNASSIMEYIVKVGGKEIAKWSSKRFNDTIDADRKDPQGLAAYANIKKGTGVTCDWLVDSNSVQGALFAAPANDEQPEGSDLLYFVEE